MTSGFQAYRLTTRERIPTAANTNSNTTAAGSGTAALAEPLLEPN